MTPFSHRGVTALPWWYRRGWGAPSLEHIYILSTIASSTQHIADWSFLSKKCFDIHRKLPFRYSILELADKSPSHGTSNWDHTASALVAIPSDKEGCCYLILKQFLSQKTWIPQVIITNDPFWDLWHKVAKEQQLWLRKHHLVDGFNYQLVAISFAWNLLINL